MSGKLQDCCCGEIVMNKVYKLFDSTCTLTHGQMKAWSLIYQWCAMYYQKAMNPYVILTPNITSTLAIIILLFYFSTYLGFVVCNVLCTSIFILVWSTFMLYWNWSTGFKLLHSYKLKVVSSYTSNLLKVTRKFFYWCSAVGWTKYLIIVEKFSFIYNAFIKTS